MTMVFALFLHNFSYGSASQAHSTPRPHALSKAYASTEPQVLFYAALGAKFPLYIQFNGLLLEKSHDIIQFTCYKGS